MSIEQYWTQNIERAEHVMLEEIRAEQVTHVTEQYQPGSERLEKLYAAIEQAQRFTWPSMVKENV